MRYAIVRHCEYTLWRTEVACALQCMPAITYLSEGGEHGASEHVERRVRVRSVCCVVLSAPNKQHSLTGPDRTASLQGDKGRCTSDAT